MRHSLIILSLLFSFNLHAQQGNWCGTFHSAEDRAVQETRLLSNQQSIEGGVVQFRDILYVPIKFHLAARNDGSGRVSEAKVLDQLCELNEDFAPHDIQFFLADGSFHYINNTALYENHTAVQNSIMQPQRDSRAMNVWILEDANTGGGGEGVTLAYYHTIRDWIVIRKASVKSNDNTLSHEVGHFFSLLHTFNGWESGSFLTENVPAPTSHDGVLTELVDGSNCQIAGDFICDTPPDYGFGFGWPNCNFTLNILDPNGDVCAPDESNMLSYFLSCPDEDYHFSDEQVALMRADFNSNFHSYLSIDPVPDYVDLTDTPNHISPAPGTTTDSYNHIVLQWSAVEGAEKYLVELSRVSGFTVNPIRRLVTGTSTLIEDLDIDKKYYWRVRPFNAHNACMPASGSESFETGVVDFATAINETPNFVSSFLVSPNPVRGQEQINVFLELTESYSGSLRMMDIAGRIVNSIENKTFIKGENHLSIEITTLSNGIYLLQLETDKGQITKKIVIAN